MPIAHGEIPRDAVREVAVGPQTRAVSAAAAAGLVLLMGAGLGHRSLSRYLDRTPTSPLIPAGTLKQLPLEIGEWAGRDEPLDEMVVQAADVDDYVNRLYVRGTDNRSARLWVAFGVRARDLVPHRPEVCYPGAGWTLRDEETVVLRLGGSAALRARILSFAPGGLDPHHLTVLNYYIVDGQTCEDVSLLRSKAWRGQASIRYMAQVQIACRTDPARPAAAPTEVVREFATATFAPIRALLDRGVEPPSSASEPDKP